MRGVQWLKCSGFGYCRHFIGWRYCRFRQGHDHPQITTAATEYAWVYRDLTEFHDSWLRVARQSGGYAGLTPQVVNAGFLPKNWRYSGGRIVDSTLHTTTVTANNKHITVNYELKNKKAGGGAACSLRNTAGCCLSMWLCHIRICCLRFGYTGTEKARGAVLQGVFGAAAGAAGGENACSR